jgi:C-terminal processing protease CtpA/Prc
MKFFVASILMFSLTSGQVSICQNISKNEIKAAVTSIATLIEKNYVFADKGKTIADQLLTHYHGGRFDKVTNWKTFEPAVTEWLQHFSGDGHLYVRNDPKTVKDLMKSETRSADTNTKKAFTFDPFYFGEAAVEKNFGFTEVKILPTNVGYIKVSEINISAKSLPVLYAAMSFVSNTKALVIDLQDNGGGGSDVGPVFESFFLARGTPLLEFKSRSGSVIKEETVSWLTEKPYDKPLFILVNKGTASAAEAFAYSLQHYKRAVIVGQRSAGGANMNAWYPVNDQLYVSVSTGAPTLPGTNESWEQKGIVPDHGVEKGKEIEWILQSLNSAKK